MKLLAADVRVSSRIVKKITHGKEISRRERNFIVKTGVDLARLVPFSLFLIIPLAEFALPFALRLFPNMLPSQFQDQMKTEEDMKRRLKGRLELAKYLRDVVEERATEIKASDANSVSYLQLTQFSNNFIHNILINYVQITNILLCDLYYHLCVNRSSKKMQKIFQNF